MGGFFTGCLGPIGPTFFAAIVDEDARRTGERHEAVYFAAKEFVEKASGAAVALMVGVVLQLSRGSSRTSSRMRPSSSPFAAVSDCCPASLC